MSKRKTHEEFVQDFNKRGVDTISIIGRYESSAKKILVQCKICDYEWLASPGHLLGGRGCPKCSGHHKRSKEEFVKEIAEKFPNLEVIGSFVNRKTPIEIKCNKCGYIWNPKANNLLLAKQYGCPKCNGTYRRTSNEFISEIKKINPNLEILGKFVGTGKNVHTRCTVCGYEWDPIASSLLHGSGCLQCGRKKEELNTEKHKKILNVN